MEEKMKLKEWLKKEKITSNEFAIKIGVTNISVCRWIRNKRYPNFMNLYAIQKMTNGEVTASDFIKKGDTNG